VKEILKEQIKQMQEDYVSDVELSQTKVFLKGTFKMELETISNLATMSTSDELYGLGYEHYKLYEEAIGKATREDVKRLAEQYLNCDQAIIVITRPLPKGESKNNGP
jgi:predicted Zn-dependent peptidase